MRLAVESSAKYITPHLFKAFQNLHPEVSLSLTVVNRTQVIKRLADNRDDLVIMSLVPQDMALEFLPFLNNPIIAVAPPDHPLCNAAKLALKDLEPFPLLVREPGSGTRKACEEFFQQRRAHFSQIQEIASLESLREGVIAGLGLALLPRHAAHQELANGLLRELPVEELPLYRSWCLVHAKGKRLSPVAQAFVAFVREERALISQLAGRFAGPGGSSEVGGGYRAGVVGQFLAQAQFFAVVLDRPTELHAPLVFELAAGFRIHVLGIGIAMTGHLASPMADWLESRASRSNVTVWRQAGEDCVMPSRRRLRTARRALPGSSSPSATGAGCAGCA